MTGDSGIFCVISNHERAPNTHIMRFLQRHGISYHYLPTTDQTKIEEDILELVKDTDFLVLARYMQVYQILSSILSSFSLLLSNAKQMIVTEPSHSYNECASYNLLASSLL